MSPKLNIDAVILWVDGDDVAHKEKLAKYLDNGNLLIKKGFKTRYSQKNEIRYCVDAILKFAPYIDNIYIVTDNQIPTFLKSSTDANYEKVKVIDHSIIFKGFEEYLPVFNSNAIETMVTRIPNLAEHYICFNDDMILIKPTHPADFFDEKGVPIIRGIKMKFEEDKFFKKLAVKLGLKKIKTSGYLGYKRKQDFFFKLMGKSEKICINHTPFPFRKKTMENFFKRNNEIFLNNIKFKFRNENNVLTQSICAFEEFNSHAALLKNDYQLVQLDSPKKNIFLIKMKLFFSKKNQKKIFINIQSLDLYSTSKINYIKKWLDKLYI